LIDGFKFDFRLYVLVNGVAPLRIYLYQDGLTRLATVPYKAPAKDNLQNLMMHLTNYAIQKHSDDYQCNIDENDDNVGHKRSYAAVLKTLREKHGNAKIDTMV
jgi:tubulin polyglutamylase TTLL6/13